MPADRGIANLSLDLGTRGQSGDGVDNNGIDGAGTHEHVNDLERLLTRIGLGNQYLVDIHANARGIRGIERVLGIDKRHDATHCLGLGQDLERKRRLTGGLGTVNLDDTAARHTADTQSGIERQSTRGDGLELGAAVTIPHDGTLTELLLDLGLGGGDHLFTLFTRRGCMDGTYGT